MEIKRDIHLKRLIASQHDGMVKVVTGVRRCGKSYLLFKLFCDYLHQQGETTVISLRWHWMTG
jgi:predicted AAA+ superfamily ATPase